MFSPESGQFRLLGPHRLAALPTPLRLLLLRPPPLEEMVGYPQIPCDLGDRVARPPYQSYRLVFKRLCI